MDGYLRRLPGYFTIISREHALRILASKRFKTHKVEKCQEWVQLRSFERKTAHKAYVSQMSIYMHLVCICAKWPNKNHLGTSCTIPFFLGTCQMSQSKTHGGLSQQLFQNRPMLTLSLSRKNPVKQYIIGRVYLIKSWDPLMTKTSVQASCSFAPSAVGSTSPLPVIGVCCCSPNNKGFIWVHQTMRWWLTNS